MKWAVVIVIAIGVWIGATVPAKKPVAAPAAAAPPASIEPKPERTVIQRDMNGHFLAHGEVDGEPIRFVVDTGADMVALTVEDARRARVEFSEAAFEPVARSASGIAYGQHVRLKNVTLDGKKVEDVPAAVIRGLDVSLLGQSYLRHIDSVQLQGDEMVLR
jgi:aspartyl protease family protein